MFFDEFDLDDEVLDGIESMNFIEASPIQELAIPPLLEKKDLLGVAQTGTGKTAAYLLPIINRIHRDEFAESQLKAVVIVPTRELAQQIDRQIQGFGYFVGVSSIAVYGGTDGIVWEQQKRSMQRGVDIIVATPGRLMDLIINKQATIEEASYLVIDEADRMLEMGFYEDILAIRKQMPPLCQIALFSATMPEKIKRLAESLLKDPVKVEIAISKPRESILQCAYICYEAQKKTLLKDFLLQSASNNKKVVVFASSKKTVHKLFEQLKKEKMPLAVMHSDLDQKERDVVMRDFKAGNIAILLATDIVARGIDIDDIDVVINYDLPRDFEDYVHRIGRTARGTDGNGLAISLVTDKECSAFDKLQTALKTTISTLPLPVALGDGPEYHYTPHKKKDKKRGNKAKKREPHKTPQGKKKKIKKEKPIRR